MEAGEAKSTPMITHRAGPPRRSSARLWLPGGGSIFGTKEMKKILFALLLVGLTGCDDSETGLPPVWSNRGYIAGTVRTTEGVPLADMRVVVETQIPGELVSDCGARDFSDQFEKFTATDSQGGYSFEVLWTAGEDVDVCLEVRTAPEEGSEFIQTRTGGFWLTMRMDPPWDTVHVDLVAEPGET